MALYQTGDGFELNSELTSSDVNTIARALWERLRFKVEDLPVITNTILRALRKGWNDSKQDNGFLVRVADLAPMSIVDADPQADLDDILNAIAQSFSDIERLDL